MWSKIFYKLALTCFDVWANELAPRHKGLARFKEKFDVLRSARVEFPENRTHYNEGLPYILGSLKEMDISLCDFTEDFSEVPSRIEASTLNISLHNYENILPQPDSHGKRPTATSVSTAIEAKPAISLPPISIPSRQKASPGLQYVAGAITEVVESQEYSEIAAELEAIDTGRGRPD